MRELSFRDRLISFLLRTLLRVLSATWRYREEVEPGCEPILRGNEPGVLSFLHGKMLPIWYRFRGGSFVALVSASRDGQLLSNYLERSLRYKRVVRGSSSRGGGQALMAMIRLLRDEKLSLLVTPDGPRGPVGVPKPGSLVAAMKGESKVVVVTWSASKVIQLNSWDRMEIPYPFAKIKCRYCIFDFPHTSDKKTIEEETLHRYQGALSADCSNDGSNTDRPER